MTEREQFEKWWDGAFTSGDPEEKHTAWCGWQAARATPALPQGEHDLEDVRCQCCGYMTYHSEHMGCIRSAYKQALPQVPEGMAIVPVERTFEAGARAFKNLMIEASHAAIHPHIEGVYGAFEHRLAATKEKGE